MNIWIAGGTGLIGRRLISLLIQKGHDITLLSRQKKLSMTLEGRVRVLLWDGKSIPSSRLNTPTPEAIVNLCGAGIADARWSSGRKRILLESRVQPILAFENYLKNSSEKPGVFLQASAVGFYGTSLENADITEDFFCGRDYLSTLCRQWEESTQGIQALGVRTVLTRTGIVLDTEGGALAKMLPPFRFFLGGPLGHGKQWFPWIHRNDEVAAMVYLLQNEKASGPFNLCAPGILTNKEFSQTLAELIHRPCFAPVPGFVLKTLLGEMSTLLLDGQKAVPKKLSILGFEFLHSKLRPALADLLIF